MLGVPISLSDLEFVDEELYKNLKWLQTHDGAEALCLDFSVTPSVLEPDFIVELKPGGKSIDVTDENKVDRWFNVDAWIRVRGCQARLGGMACLNGCPKSVSPLPHLFFSQDEYILLMLKYKMLEAFRPQLTEMLRGLYDIVPRKILSVFDYQELELLIRCAVLVV